MASISGVFVGVALLDEFVDDVARELGVVFVDEFVGDAGGDIDVWGDELGTVGSVAASSTSILSSSVKSVCSTQCFMSLHWLHTWDLHRTHLFVSVLHDTHMPKGPSCAYMCSRLPMLSVLGRLTCRCR